MGLHLVFATTCAEVAGHELALVDIKHTLLVDLPFVVTIAAQSAGSGLGAGPCLCLPGFAPRL